jgi:hypothetical protein
MHNDKGLRRALIQWAALLPIVFAVTFFLSPDFVTAIIYFVLGMLFQECYHRYIAAERRSIARGKVKNMGLRRVK